MPSCHTASHLIYCSQVNQMGGLYEYFKSTFSAVGSTDLFKKSNAASTNNSFDQDFQIIYRGITVIVPSLFQADSLTGLMKALQEL